jgi:hypothetical protein
MRTGLCVLGMSFDFCLSTILNFKRSWSFVTLPEVSFGQWQRGCVWEWWRGESWSSWECIIYTPAIQVHLLLHFRSLSVLAGYLFAVYVSSVQRLSVIAVIFLQDSLRHGKEVHGNQSRKANRSVANVRWKLPVSPPYLTRISEFKPWLFGRKEKHDAVSESMYKRESVLFLWEEDICCLMLDRAYFSATPTKRVTRDSHRIYALRSSSSQILHIYSTSKLSSQRGSHASVMWHVKASS